MFTLFEDGSPEPCDFLYRIIVVECMIEVEADVPGSVAGVSIVLEKTDSGVASRKSYENDGVRTVAFLKAIGVAVESSGDIEVANGKDEQNASRPAH